MRTRDKGRSAGLSKEMAELASELSRRPAQRGSRNATTSACVGWDLTNIENRLAFRKRVANIRGRPQRPAKRSDHYQDNDPYHQDRRYLIDNAIKFLASRISIGGKILDAAGKKSMHAG